MTDTGAAPNNLSIADPFLTLFLSFLTYLLVILTGICVVWLFPVVKNGGGTPTPDVFIRWATTAAAFIHSTIMTSVGCQVIFFESWNTRDIFEGKSAAVPTFIAWEVGYLSQQALFKCYLMIENNRTQGLGQLSKFVVSICTLPWYNHLDISDFFMGLFFLSYFSDIFSNLRALLGRGGKERSRLYRVVTIMCPFSFILCRFLPIFYVLFRSGIGFEYGWHKDIPTWTLAFVLLAFLYNTIALYQLLKQKAMRKIWKTN